MSSYVGSNEQTELTSKRDKPVDREQADSFWGEEVLGGWGKVLSKKFL